MSVQYTRHPVIASKNVVKCSFAFTFNSVQALPT